MWLLLLASIWGASYMLIKIGLRDLSAPMIAWVRIALAAAVLMPVAASQRALGAVRGRAGTVAIVPATNAARVSSSSSRRRRIIAGHRSRVVIDNSPVGTPFHAPGCGPCTKV